MTLAARLGVTTEDQTLADVVGRFAVAELAPLAKIIDDEEKSVTCHLPRLAELGLLGINLPEHLGGSGVTPTAMLLALVEISKSCAATSSMLGAHYLGTDAVLIGGNADQHQTWLPNAALGRSLGCFALTEPRGGSNPADIRTKAVRDGGGYRVDGVKHFISNAGEADFMVIFAKTDIDAGHRGVSAFVVDRRARGIQVAKPEKLMGIRGAHAFEVSFDGLFVPAQGLLGSEGAGFKLAMKVLDNSRLDVVATALGIAEAALSAAIEWAKSRIIGGGPLATKQGIQWMLANMKLQLEAAWGLALQATTLRSEGKPFSQQSAMAKLFASEMVGFVTDGALQIHGGLGYTREAPLERYVRDARILRIYEGSSEVQRTIISRGLLG